MKKIIGGLLLLFAVTFAVGASTTSVQSATCYYTCSCTGTPLQCCVNNGVTTCKFTTKIRCLQIITC